MKRTPTPRNISRNIKDKAASLQRDYEAINVAPTQYVRNPIPMRELVLSVLPKLPADPFAIMDIKEVTTTFYYAGKKYKKSEMIGLCASDVYGTLGFHQKLGLTVAEIQAKLQAQGFRAPYLTVVNAVSVQKTIGKINGVVTTRKFKQRGCCPTKYYVEQETPLDARMRGMREEVEQLKKQREQLVN